MTRRPVSPVLAPREGVIWRRARMALERALRAPTGLAGAHERLGLIALASARGAQAAAS